LSLLFSSNIAIAGGAPPTLTIDGACPGRIAIEATLTPGATATVLYSNSPGASVLPFGRCAGMVTGLDRGRWAFNAPDGDGDGALSFSPVAPEGACGQWLQVIDTSTCLASPAVQIGADDPFAGGLVAGDGRNGMDNGFYHIDLDAGVAMRVGSPRSYTGLAFDASGSLWGVEANGSGERNLYELDPATGDGALMYTDGYAAYGGWSGLTAVGDDLYHWDEADDALYHLDVASGVDTFIYSDSSGQHCIAANAAGEMYRIDSRSVSSIDYIAGTQVYLGDISGLGSSGQGTSCTFHNGSLYLITGGDYGGYYYGDDPAPPGGYYSPKAMYHVDLDTLVATDVGIDLGSESIDALASPTP
ncbi:MAG: hypothetical protein ACI8PZ_005772, partial [Myxococcota bacterium]